MTYLYSEDISSDSPVMHIVKCILGVPGVFILDKCKSVALVSSRFSEIRSRIDVPRCRNVAAHKSSKAAGELAIVREVKRRVRKEDREEGMRERRRTG